MSVLQGRVLRGGSGSDPEELPAACFDVPTSLSGGSKLKKICVRHSWKDFPKERKVSRKLDAGPSLIPRDHGDHKSMEL